MPPDRDSVLPEFEPRESDAGDGVANEGDVALPVFGPQFPAYDPSQDACHQERLLEVRYKPSRGWEWIGYGLIPNVGAAVFFGLGLGLDWRWDVRGVAVASQFILFLALLGLGMIAIGYWQLHDRTVRIRLDEVGFHDFRSGASYSWSDVRGVVFSKTIFKARSSPEGLNDDRSSLIFGDTVDTASAMAMDLEVRGVERTVWINLDGLDRPPESIARVAQRFSAADPAVALERLRKSISLAFDRGEPISAITAGVASRGLDGALAVRLVVAEAGGSGARCGRCNLAYHFSKTQCPRCWERLAPVELRAGV